MYSYVVFRLSVIYNSKRIVYLYVVVNFKFLFYFTIILGFQIKYPPLYLLYIITNWNDTRHGMELLWICGLRSHGYATVVTKMRVIIWRLKFSPGADYRSRSFCLRPIDSLDFAVDYSSIVKYFYTYQHAVIAKKNVKF